MSRYFALTLVRSLLVGVAMGLIAEDFVSGLVAAVLLAVALLLTDEAN